MATKTYQITVTNEYTVHVAKELFDHINNDDWRNTFYHITTMEGLAEHLIIATNGGKRSISDLDGFADLTWQQSVEWFRVWRDEAYVDDIYEEGD